MLFVKIVGGRLVTRDYDLGLVTIVMNKVSMLFVIVVGGVSVLKMAIRVVAMVVGGVSIFNMIKMVSGYIIKTLRLRI